MKPCDTIGGIILDGIKIYVSHRIDIDSELIDNPLYVPMRCGAVFDEENPMNIPGDDTGDNISRKRMTFCEFTVQYWAWKNAGCDYYGLCHYRRFLSFAEKRFRINDMGMVHLPELTPGMKKKMGLLDSEKMDRVIRQYDIVTSQYADVRRMVTPKGRVETVREMWDAHDGVFFEKSTIDLMFELIEKLFPQYYESAKEYFGGSLHRGFNCFVMKKELFFRMCEFQFAIMNKIEELVDTTEYTQTMKRTPGFVGEMLYGIFIYHVTKNENVSVKELQLVFFVRTDRIKSGFDLLRRKICSAADRAARFIFDPIFPKGSKRREKLKDIYYRVTGKPRRGEAVIKEKQQGS